MEDVIINKVAQSTLETIDLEKYLPKEDIAVFDLKDHLFMELILKEKEFREALKNTEWNIYKGKYVAITCSADAIIPVWAYMLVTSYLQPVSAGVHFGDEKSLKEKIWLLKIEAINPADFSDKRVVIKGCGEIAIPEAAYVAVTNKLRPVVKSIMYGEPCSSVPIYKQPKQLS